MTEVRLIDGDLTVSDVSALLDRLIAATGEESSEFADIVELVKDAVLKNIGDQPTIEAEPVRHGRWIPTEYDSYADGAPVWDKWECSECGHEHSGEEDTLTAFCPSCGARMNLRSQTEAALDEADSVMLGG